MWFKRHWLGILGAVSLLGPLCKSLWHFIGHAGDVDFFVGHIRDLGWAGEMIAWLLDPPAWSIIPMILAGLCLIWYDLVRRSKFLASQGSHQAGNESEFFDLRVRLMSPETVIGVGLLLTCAGMVWYYTSPLSRLSAPTLRAKDEASGSREVTESETKQAEVSDEQNKPVVIVQLESRERPSTFPASGYVDGIDLTPFGQIAGRKEGKPGSSTGWKREYKNELDLGYRCRLLLVAAQPIYNVNITFVVGHHTSIKNSAPNSIKAGALINRTEVVYNIKKIAPDENQDIWLYSQTANFVEIERIASINYEILDSGKRAEARVSLDVKWPFVLVPKGPFEETLRRSQSKPVP